VTARSLRVVAVASNKGGVGKTTLAVNLAVMARVADPTRPVLVIGLDDQNLIDRMFGDGEPCAPNVAEALRGGDLASAIRPGRHGIHYVPTSPAISQLKMELSHPRLLRERLEQSGFLGLVLVDTKSDLEILTQNAIWASDLTLVPVTDETSLLEAEKVFRLLEGFGRSRESARIVLSLVDLRIKYRNAEHGDVLAWLLAQVRARGLPLFETFISRSPRIEALHTNSGGRPMAVLEQARDSLVCGQLRHLAEDLLRALPTSDRPAEIPLERRAQSRLPYRAQLVAFRGSESRLVQLDAHDLSRSGLGASADARLEPGECVHLALRSAAGEPALVWARVVRSDGFAFEGGSATQAAQVLNGLNAAQVSGLTRAGSGRPDADPSPPTLNRPAWVRLVGASPS
jgi:cellulose biosynthesis protein BcsQ